MARSWDCAIRGTRPMASSSIPSRCSPRKARRSWATSSGGPRGDRGHRQARQMRVVERGRGRGRLRDDHARRRHTSPDRRLHGRAAHEGGVCRGAHGVCPHRESAGNTHRSRRRPARYMRHRRRRPGHLQYLDARGDRGRGLWSEGRQAWKSGGILFVRVGRRPRAAGGEDRPRPGWSGALHRASRHRVPVRADLSSFFSIRGRATPRAGRALRVQHPWPALQPGGRQIPGIGRGGCEPGREDGGRPRTARRRARDRVPCGRRNGRAVHELALARDRDRRGPQGVSARSSRGRFETGRPSRRPRRRPRGERSHRSRGARGRRWATPRCRPLERGCRPESRRPGEGLAGRDRHGGGGHRFRAGRRRASKLGENLPRVTSSDLLARLVADARLDMERRRALTAPEELERAIHVYQPKDFVGALRGPGLAVIAEMKQRTPTMGVLAEDYKPADLARAYTAGGASALSVLTHMAGFGGRPEHIEMARLATNLPILRKDFITDPYEIGEARAAGADAVLLIVAALELPELRRLLAVARSRGISALVEVHDENETRVAIEAGAQVVVVNHRDLRTFEVDLGLTMKLRPLIPDAVPLVAESGIRSIDDARRMSDAGADAILVGEMLMRAVDPVACLRELASL